MITHVHEWTRSAVKQASDKLYSQDGGTIGLLDCGLAIDLLPVFDPVDTRVGVRVSAASRALAFIVALVASLIVAPSAYATGAINEVMMTPGELLVELSDSTSHTVVIEDSLRNRNPPSVAFFAGPVTGAVSGVAISNAAPLVEQSIARPMPWWGIAVQAVLILGAVALGQELDAHDEEKYEPIHVVKVSDLEGHPISINPISAKYCRPVVRDARTNGVIPATVECEILPANMSTDALADAHPIEHRGDPLGLSRGPFPTPALVVYGGFNHRNRVAIKQHFAATFRKRMLWGGGADDVFVGSRFPDEMVGLMGNDRMYGGDGGDWLVGLQGHAAAGAIIGTDSGEANHFGEIFTDDDVLYGQDDSDVLWGYKGNDLILGGRGDDNLSANAFNPGGRYGDGAYVTVPALFGGSGQDTVIGGAGSDWMAGGADRDTILASEKDFGQPFEEADLLGGDCGPNLGQSVGREYFRVSKYPNGEPMEPISTCNFELPNSYPIASKVYSWQPGEQWPWFADFP